ncbi:MAG: hypothetical protein VXZ82_09740 [Planctomycetota bacterium]|nr:hypothetical protein [Planctomycetota bacterium]
MCKKFIVLGVLGAVAAVGLLSTGAMSYVRTGYNTASAAVKESVPIDWEIKRARDMIKSLKPEIDKSRALVAREEVKVARLAKEVQAKEEMLVQSQKDILRLKGDLEGTTSTRFVYAGRTYTAQQVRDDLESRFDQFKVAEETTHKLSQVLLAREKNLDAARRKLDGMQSAKRQLEVEIENLQARLTMVEVAQTNNPVDLDDSHLSQTRDLLDQLAIRIEMQETMHSTEGGLVGNIQLDDPKSPELLNEIANYFDGTSSKSEIEGNSEVLLSSSND